MPVQQFQSALPRGERLFHVDNVSSFPHFNPRSREGSDVGIVGGILGVVDFNPRSREGSDAEINSSTFSFSISIRAPARGATKVHEYRHPKPKKFQSALPRGERQLSGYCLFCIRQFQSALPRGERPVLRCKLLPHKDFNPRSREGSDDIDRFSHSTPHNFNPRSREGSDSISIIGFLLISHFNPRSREGSDKHNRSILTSLL